MLNTLKKYSIHALLAVGFILLSYIIAFLLISIIKIVIKFHTYFIYKKYSLTPNFLNNTSNINLNEKNLDYKNLSIGFIYKVIP